MHYACLSLPAKVCHIYPEHRWGPQLTFASVTLIFLAPSAFCQPWSIFNAKKPQLLKSSEANCVTDWTASLRNAATRGQEWRFNWVVSSRFTWTDNLPDEHPRSTFWWLRGPRFWGLAMMMSCASHIGSCWAARAQDLFIPGSTYVPHNQGCAWRLFQLKWLCSESCWWHGSYCIRGWRTTHVERKREICCVYISPDMWLWLSPWPSIREGSAHVNHMPAAR